MTTEPYGEEVSPPHAVGERFVTTRQDVASQFLETARRRGSADALRFSDHGVTFAKLATRVERLAAGFRRAGIEPGDRVALLVPVSEDFFAATFALFRTGAVPVLIDPGIGFANMGRCLAEAEPSAFVGSPLAHAARLFGRWAPSSKLNLVAGWLPGLWSLDEVERMGGRVPTASGGGTSSPYGSVARVDLDAPAAILFTSGSTGAPKGAVYTHGVFAAQVELLREMFDVKEGELTLPTFPLFALFDVALGMTAVIPDMDFTRPGSVDPRAIIEPIEQAEVQQLFGSPALLDRVARDGAPRGVALSSLKRVLSAGAPVRPKTLEAVKRLLAPGVQVFTPYGATECLPVALIGSDEILNETASGTAEGKGICVGRPVRGAQVEIVALSDEPIAQWSEDLRRRPGQVGEIVVKGPMVTREYFRRPEATAAAKIKDGGDVRHRMGDLGYFDEKGRLWFCGRMSQRVKTADGELYTVQVEGVFNAHPKVRRTALVGARGRPVLCVELEPGTAITEELTRELLLLGAKYDVSRGIRTILYHPGFPVDIRHNAKIFREKLAVWAEAEASD